MGQEWVDPGARRPTSPIAIAPKVDDRATAAITGRAGWRLHHARLGLAPAVTDAVARLLGRPPVALRRFVADYRACWA